MTVRVPQRPRATLRIVPSPTPYPPVRIHGVNGFPVVGVVGGGQLARMMQPAAVELGVRLRVLAESAQASAAQVIPDAPVGDRRDPVAVSAFAADCDVLTFDHEHVPGPLLEKLVADAVAGRPRPEAVR